MKTERRSLDTRLGWLLYYLVYFLIDLSSALKQSEVVVASPSLVQEHLDDLRNVKWVHSYYAGIVRGSGTIVKACVCVCVANTILCVKDSHFENNLYTNV